ncbi:MAG TPA: decaprenylphospho-beta-D-erythro-pentofuranosid-2-ulose 2-reductase [Acidimicrobiales bacterium]|jgi:decaprenylphospho-beta-D-erythro-pentofuranosid-2-ulose 2-reductase|nr:decaprenylphospho-beta-D-erythro-pentofuranosid-2-ulose 2-reductase [Acidimicrobiales bacterium]
MKNALGAVQSALVLGGGSEIAQATLHRLVPQGCRTVVLAARRPEELASEIDALHEAGATNVTAVTFDALDTASHAGIINSCFAGGDIDLVIIAFGVLGDQAVLDDDPEAAAELARANYVGVVSSGLAAARALRRQGHGTIVVLSSVAGERVRKANFVYGSTKAAADAFAQGLGDSLAGSGVRVLVVRPGFVHTKMTAGMEAAPFATGPDDVANAIVHGLASGKEIVWVPPALRFMMSAFRHMPRAAWRRVSASR